MTDGRTKARIRVREEEGEACWTIEADWARAITAGKAAAGAGAGAVGWQDNRDNRRAPRLAVPPREQYLDWRYEGRRKRRFEPKLREQPVRGNR